MHKGQFIFTQVCKFLPKRAFDCLVNKYDGTSGSDSIKKPPFETLYNLALALPFLA